MKSKRSATPRTQSDDDRRKLKIATPPAKLLTAPVTDGHSPIQAQRQQVKAALIRAAIDVIGEQGFAAARVEAIARRAGVGYGTFYNYFSNKLSLIEDVLTQIYEEIHESWYRVPKGLRPFERIRHGLHQALEMNQRYGSILVALSEPGNLSQQVNEMRNAQWHRDVRDTEKLIRRYKKEGYEPPGDPHLLAMALTSMTDEVIRRWLEEGAKIPKEEIAETLVAIIQSVLLSTRPGEETLSTN